MNFNLNIDCPDILTVKEVMQILKISKTTVYSMIKDNVIRSLNVRGTIRVPRDWLIQSLEACSNENKYEVVADENKIAN